jgi:hypothetical protein
MQRRYNFFKTSYRKAGFRLLLPVALQKLPDGGAYLFKFQQKAVMPIGRINQVKNAPGIWSAKNRPSSSGKRISECMEITSARALIFCKAASLPPRLRPRWCASMALLKK